MISQRIREIRLEKKISQKELAGKLFVSPQAVSKWERNEATPNPEAVAKMAEIFDVSADYLLGRTDQKDTPVPEGERIVRDEEIRAAFFGGADDLTEEEMDAMWHDAKDYIQYKLEQRRKLKHG